MRKSQIKTIRDLKPEKGQKNWPIMVRSANNKHLKSKCGNKTSKKRLPFCKFALEDESGKVDAIAYDNGLAAALRRRLKVHKVIIIKKAELRRCNGKYLDYQFYIKIDEDTVWEYEQSPRKQANIRKVSRREPEVRKTQDTSTNADADERETSDERETPDKWEKQFKQMFLDLSRDLIHPEWKFYFRYLFGENAETFIDEAVLNNPGNVREQIHVLLKDWVIREKEKATYERLCEALTQQGREDLIEKYVGRMC